MGGENRDGKRKYQKGPLGWVVRWWGAISPERLEEGAEGGVGALCRGRGAAQVHSPRFGAPREDKQDTWELARPRHGQPGSTS